MPRTRRTPKKARAKPKEKPDWAPRFFEVLRAERMVTAACKAAEVGRSTVYDRRRNDEAFRETWDAIEQEITDALEREAFRRSTLGVERVIYHKGEEVGREREFSDTLLIFLLKARKPEVYRENVKVVHSGPSGGPIQTKSEVDIASPKVRKHLDAALAASAEAERGAD